MNKVVRSISKKAAVLAACAAVVLVMGVAAASAAPGFMPCEEVLKHVESKSTDILVVDANPEGVFDYGHVPGAVNVPWAPEISDPNLPRDKTLVLYCACAHDEDSTDVALQLVEKFGYDTAKVLVMEGGWNKWFELGYPQEKAN